MFFKLVSFELHKASHKPAYYLYFAVLFSLSFLVVNAAAGAFDAVRFQLVGANAYVNGASLISMILSYFNILSVFVVAAIVGSLVYADYQYNTLSMTFSSGVSRFDLLIGKLLACFIIASLVMSGAIFGHMVACLMPYLDADYFGDFNLIYYLSPFFKTMLPNLAALTLLFFAFTLMFRTSLINWVLVLFIYGISYLASHLSSDIDSRWLGALLDPFGQKAAKFMTIGAGITEGNTQTIDLEGLYLWNRLLWLMVSSCSFFWAYFRFDFMFHKSNWSLPRWLRLSHSGEKDISRKPVEFNLLSRLHSEKLRENSFSQTFKIWHNCWLMEMKFLLMSAHFVVFLIIGAGLLYLSSGALGIAYETQTYAVTYQLVELIISSFDLLLYLLISLLSAELIWRERDNNCAGVQDALPVSNYTLLSSKLAALLSMVSLVLLLTIAGGILIQYNSGYFEYEVEQYFNSLFGLEFVNYILLAVFAFFIQVMVNNKYAAILLLLAYYFTSSFGLNFSSHNLLQYAGAPSWIYSDMNSYGTNMFPYLLLKSYWLLFAILLLFVTKVFWIRGEILNLTSRLTSSITKFKSLKKPLLLTSFVWVLLGGYIFYNINILNTYTTASEVTDSQVNYEQQYSQYLDLPQPKIITVDVQADIFPTELLLSGSTQYRLSNQTEVAIETIHLNYEKDWLSDLVFSRTTHLEHSDPKLNYHIYRFSSPLQPGETVDLSFNFKRQPKGFSNNGVITAVENNGTFYNPQALFPRLGYLPNKEIVGDRQRKKYDLPVKPLSLSRDDPKGRQQSFLRADSNFIDLTVTLSTSEEQMAFAPGDLIKQWQANGRNYFRYESKSKVQNYMAFLSGEYQVLEDNWLPEGNENEQLAPVKLSIYYHKGHEYNTRRMMDSMKRSLDYYSSHFSPYQQEQIRIIEFPRTKVFAQSFASNIPFSEGIGFIADLRDIDDQNIPFEKQKVDYPFYVTAHEIAHQWWAHQVSAAGVEGASFIIESLSQYSALKVMEQEYGKSQVKKFLRIERQRYLLSRNMEQHEERPLARVLNSQQSTYYNKGAVSLYALGDYLGESVFDAAIKDFISDFAFKSERYPTTADFIDLLYQHSPKEYHYFIADHLEKITFYDTELTEAVYSRNEELRYEVTINFNAEKFYSDAEGNETTAALDDLLEVGIYNSKGKELYLQKVSVKAGKNTLQLNLSRKPSKVIIDPYYKVFSKGLFQPTLTFEKSIH